MSLHQKRADQLNNGDLIILRDPIEVVVEVRGVMQFTSEGPYTHLALHDEKTGVTGEFKVRNQQKFDVYEPS